MVEVSFLAPSSDENALKSSPEKLKDPFPRFQDEIMPIPMEKSESASSTSTFSVPGCPPMSSVPKGPTSVPPIAMSNGSHIRLSLQSTAKGKGKAHDGKMSNSMTAPGRLDKEQTSRSNRHGPKTKLEDFELIRVLGKGCAGKVLLVKHTPSNAIRAMKALSKRSVLTHDEVTHTLAELSILRKFAVQEPDNRFISALHETFTDKENFYFVMEFYPGGDLATQMEIHGILGHHRTRFYAVDLTQGLEDLHRHGIIVRDLKPENILLNARGHAVLADFGLSKDFGYRGDPLPLHVITYPDQEPPPEWAGAGMASARITTDGSRRLVMDRASSFVGTSEYLSPEVVKRAEYTYAVDWWALGCIILEGLIGRVPFRKDEDEPPVVLYNKILLDPWYEVLEDRRIASRPIEDYGLDPVTWHFIDSLLQKDPMWRLTEPFVKSHEYFQYIDWQTVRAGEYDDPHTLDIHPIQEYNTIYFPKLCLEEEPSVDMSSHDAHYIHDSAIATPLNDNSLYALECAKFRKEIEDFTWSRDDYLWDEPEEVGRGVEGQVEIQQEDKTSDMEIAMSDEMGEVVEDVTVTPEATKDIVEGSIRGPDVVTEEVMADDANIQESETDNQAQILPLEPTPAIPVDGQPPLAELDQSTSEPKYCGTPVIDHAEETLCQQKSLEPVPVGIPIRRAKSEHRLSYGAVSTASRPSSIFTSSSPPFNLSPITNVSPVSQHSRVLHDLRLPSGLPSSGLSVSDLVSIPSPGAGGPDRIFRRHPLLSEETIAAARLSVELNGTITHLDDDDWEELDLGEAKESAPNGAPSSFFTRVLKRRPSGLQSSSLSRQVKISNSSRSTVSPIKGKASMMGNGTVRNEASGSSGTVGSRKSDGDWKFGSDRMGSTKKALAKLKVFPKFRKVSTGEGTNIASKAMDTREIPELGSDTPRKARKLLEGLEHHEAPTASPTKTKFKPKDIVLDGKISDKPPQISPLMTSFGANQLLPNAPNSASASSANGSDGSSTASVKPAMAKLVNTEISKVSDSSPELSRQNATDRPTAMRRHTAQDKHSYQVETGGVGLAGSKVKLKKERSITRKSWGRKMASSMTPTKPSSNDVGMIPGSSKASPRPKGIRSSSIGNMMGARGVPATPKKGNGDRSEGDKVPKLELSTPPLSLDIAWDA